MDSYITILWFVAFIAVFIWIKRDEKRKWETVYEVFSDKSSEIQMRYNYLKKKGIRCRLKNYTPGNIRMTGMQGAQMSKQSTIQLQVNRKETNQAFQHLTKFNKLDHEK